MHAALEVQSQVDLLVVQDARLKGRQDIDDGGDDNRQD